MLRKNDPLLLALLFLLIMGLRLVLLFPELPITTSLLKYLVVGEKLDAGDFRLYSDLWTDLSPLAAWLYLLLDFVFGRSVYAHVFLSGVLVFIQSVIFSDTLRRFDVMTEKNYLPAFVYALLMHLFFDFTFLSPGLIGNTFLLLFVRTFFKLNKEKCESDVFYVAGLFFGLAILSRYSSVILLIFALPAIILYSKASARQSIIFVLGVLFPLLFLYAYYFWHSETHFLMSNFIGSIKNYRPSSERVQLIQTVYFLPAFVFFAALFISYKSRFFVSFQDICRQSMLLWVIFCIPIIFYTKSPDATVYMPAIIGISLFISDLFIVPINKKVAIAFKYLLWGGIGFIFWSGLIEFKLPGTFYAFSLEYPLTTQSIVNEDLLRGKKILVFGDNLQPYKNARLATPYFDFELSKKHLLHADNIKWATEIHDNFTGDMPEVIIDENNIFTRLEKTLPLITGQYSKVSDNVYVLNNNAEQ